MWPAPSLPSPVRRGRYELSLDASTSASSAARTSADGYQGDGPSRGPHSQSAMRGSRTIVGMPSRAARCDGPGVVADHETASRQFVGIAFDVDAGRRIGLAEPADAR